MGEKEKFWVDGHSGDNDKSHWEGNPPPEIGAIDEVADFIPDPEGMEQLEGMERTDKVIEYDETVQAQTDIPTFDPQKRAEQYYEGMKMSREEYKTIKKMDRNKMQDFFNAYVTKRTQQGMGLYAEIMLGQYLEVLTQTLKEKFEFTDEQINDLNKTIEDKGKPIEDSNSGIDENGNAVEVEVVEE